MEDPRNEELKYKKKVSKMEDNLTEAMRNGSSLDFLTWTEPENASLYNGTTWSTIYSTTWDNGTDSLNATYPTPKFCDVWEEAQHNLFQTANMFLAAAFIVPKNFKQNILIVR